MQALLAGIRVVDLAGEPAAIAGRVLADLGAEVVVVEPPGGHPLRAQEHRWAAWAAGKRAIEVSGADDPRLDALLAEAHAVLTTPGFPGVLDVDETRAPNAVWLSVTPFGLTGPRASWRASDLGVLASSGNMYPTGNPERPPVRCTEPSGYAHTGGEAAFAVLTALWTGHPHRIDLSMQECVEVANMAFPAGFAKTGMRGKRLGPQSQRTREIWPASDGWVSFGLRGGKARIPTLELITKLVADDDVDASVLEAQDWHEWNPNNVAEEVLRAVEQPIAEYFARHTMRELYEIACETNLMLAPANSAREILQSKQLEARSFFVSLDGIERLPGPFVQVRAYDGEAAPAGPQAGSPRIGASDVAFTDRAHRPTNDWWSAGRPAWDGVKILELGSGAAGPIATRYFAEHGATVLRIESRARPDFLRVYALGPENPHGLEGAPMFDALNVGKRNVTLNLKHPDAVALVRRLVVEWADAVAENYAPRAMKGFGLDYDALATVKPDLVMISACLNGQTGPHKDYPGFGGQGAALSGYNWLTGWPDLEPVGPYATITDSLAPRYVAAALAAGLHYRSRTGQGVYLDVSQVESGTWTLAPTLVAAQVDDVVAVRDGNRSNQAVPHGAFPCADEGAVGDRWIAIACWADDEWACLASIIGVDDPSLATLEARQSRVDEVEAAVAAWTRDRTRAEVAEMLQIEGIEAVPVEDFGDIYHDEQLNARGHFVPLTHPFMGPGMYEHNGFRLSDASSGYDRAGPTLGQDNDWVLGELLGLSADEQGRLRNEGAVEDSTPHPQ